MPTEKGLPNPPDQPNWIKEGVITDEVWRWMSRLFNTYPKIQTFSKTLTPASVGANSESVQTFTVTGTTTNDIVNVNKPTNQSGLDVVWAKITAANTLSIKFRNHTGGAIVPTSETYLITTVRL